MIINNTIWHFFRDRRSVGRGSESPSQVNHVDFKDVYLKLEESINNIIKQTENIR